MALFENYASLPPIVGAGLGPLPPGNGGGWGPRNPGKRVSKYRQVQKKKKKIIRIN